MFDYQHDYIPAKPVIEVGLSLPGSSLVKTTTAMLVDSGADKTMIAVDVLHFIGAKSIDRVRVRGIFGASRSTELYVVDLQIGIHRIRAVEVAALSEGDESIQGRDVLNQLIVTLNGLASVTEVAA